MFQKMQTELRSLKVAVTIAAMLLGTFTTSNAFAQTAQTMVKAFNLSENGGEFIYDASTDATKPTEAQKRLLEIKQLGGNHIILNVRGRMIGGTTNEIIPVTPPNERARESQSIIRLVKYAKSLGLTVGLRPIFFVVGPNGEFPYTETLASGEKKLWWHGNIQPSNPNRWFESFRVFLDQYLLVARVAAVEEFTIGAELYSMTVGVEDQWKEFPYGFPGRWLNLLKYARTKLPKARLMYDINFTDDSVKNDGFEKVGGELERWRYRLVDLANPTNESERLIWQQLVEFWTGLDAIGIDMYRSLGDSNVRYSSDYKTLVGQLKERTESYAGQLDNVMTEIAVTLGVEKPVIMKEVGYRSVELGFIDPFTYAGTGKYNEMHQAAAYEALFEAFWAPGWRWFQGIGFWDIPIDPANHGPQDIGFSPIRKKATEGIVKKYFAPKP